MTAHDALVAANNADGLTTGQFVAGLALIAAAAVLGWLFPTTFDDAGHQPLRLNQERRKTDRGGYQQVDADDLPLDIEWPERRTA